MSPSAAQANRRIAAWLFAGFLAFNISVTRGHFYLSDEVQVFQQARSLWERGNLAVTPNINTVRGRAGLYYAQYGVGQSVLALPFYVAGKEVHRILNRLHASSWVATFAGPPVGDENMRWGGEVEIFFVNLFCAVVMAALMAMFYWFNVRLGAEPRWTVAATLLLGLTTHLTGFGVEFLQHPAEALSLLLAFYFLFLDSLAARGRDRWLAGISVAILILVRASGIVLVPALSIYLLWNVIRRAAKWRDASWQLAQFLIPVAASVWATMLINHAKWGELSFSGSYAAFNSFSNSWLVSLDGYLFSPGQSVFLFSPILLLAPWYFRPFARRYTAEAAAILALTLSYTLFYGRSLTWHGQWCFGPRYLVALVPLLLLPLAMWLGVMRRAAWLAIVPLAAIGAFIEVLHVAINVSYVMYREGYDKLVPKDAYIFIPQISQIVAHWRALKAFDDRVDLWLVNVARGVSVGRSLELLIPLLWLMLNSYWEVSANLRILQKYSPKPSPTR